MLARTSMLERAGYRHYDIEPMLPKLSATIVGRALTANGIRADRQRSAARHIVPVVPALSCACGDGI